MSIEWHWKKFDELSLEELYQILKIRHEVFIVEQNCIYDDIDGLDQKSLHLFAKKSDNICAYLRIVPPNIKYKTPAIGRVLTTMDTRGSGIGKELMIKAIEKSKTIYPNQKIKIHAQKYLEKFYSDLGFKTISDQYSDAGIPHIDMEFINI